MLRVARDAAAAATDLFWRHIGSRPDRAWLGFVVYFGADFFFNYTMTHLSESAGRASPICRRCGALFLYLGGARIDQQMVFGVLIILLAMFQMQAGTRD